MKRILIRAAVVLLALLYVFGPAWLFRNVQATPGPRLAQQEIE